MNMASQKQIEANRRNALKSTGPLSASGKKRASRNAYRHGLSTPMDSDFARAVEDLAHCILGDTEDKHAVDLARHAAEAELELARVRRVRMALIERAAAFGRLDLPKIFRSTKDETAWIVQHFLGATLWKGRPKFAAETLPAMPVQEPQRTTEAVRRVLPDLLRLYRYESRAAARRDRAIREFNARQHKF